MFTEDKIKQETGRNRRSGTAPGQLNEVFLLKGGRMDLEIVMVQSQILCDG